MQCRMERKPGFVLAVVENEIVVGKHQFERANYCSSKTVTSTNMTFVRCSRRPLTTLARHADVSTCPFDSINESRSSLSDTVKHHPKIGRVSVEGRTNSVRAISNVLENGPARVTYPLKDRTQILRQHPV